MRFLFLNIIFICLVSCTRDTPQGNSQCAIPAIVPFQSYSDPVWHANGQLLGFNHQPLTGVYENGTRPCTWFMNGIKTDSIGFYLLNKNGTGFKRVTNFTLAAPAWSPDGNWIAFSIGAHIYKMPFNNSTFDTTQIIQLTTSGANFFPSWTANSDSIYFDSNNNAPAGTSFYSIWKMASNGNSKVQFSSTTGAIYGRQPFVGTDNKIYYQGYVSSQPEIFSINKDGSNQTQITYASKNGVRRNPQYYQGKIFFWDGGLYNTPTNPFTPQNLVLSNETYNISSNGEVVYATAEYAVKDRRDGTLWLMNADGTNKKQLTFNIY